MNRILIVLIFIVALYSKPKFYLDYKDFRIFGKEYSLVEFYLSIPNYSLKFNNLEASFSVSIKVLQNGEIIASDFWGEKVVVKSNNETKSIVETPTITKLVLKPGIYSLNVEVKDLNSKESESLSISESSSLFKVENYNNAKISSIDLCSSIDIDKNSDEYFGKNGLFLLPNPRKIYGTRKPFLYYYNEFYNLSTQEEYSVNWVIKNSKSEIVSSGEPKFFTPEDEFRINSGRVKVHNLKTGMYTFILLLKSPSGKEFKREVGFTTYRHVDKIAKDVTKGVDKVESTITKLNSREVEEEFNQVMSIATEREKNIGKKLSKDGIRNFLIGYWKKKEKVLPGIRAKFLYLVELANSRYGSEFNKGWKSDRGRILIKYGKPDRKDISSLSGDKRDHEIWEYFNTGFKYVFLDKHGNGRYKLIHSDNPNEISDENWKSKLDDGAEKRQ
ncbi:MAG: hypothetical protein CR982_02405 [Candidatus Cloacimonadota bacterium]|nr:MAG: hypothetical protein CR982_02405 [Candidatus Cloacimonadota bacterium]PIE78545.1 MAG: hypothetical protein CSA15_07575 [Candidatus Delongbacteria bacterium]